MKRFIIILLTLVLSISLFACKKEEEKIDPDNGKTPVIIEVNKDTIPDAIDTEEFDLSVIKVIITYEDTTIRQADLTEDMVDPSDLESLKEGASKRVTIVYKDCTCKANITTINYKALDPVIGTSDAIIMIRRNTEKSKIEIATLSNNGVLSFQCAFKFDASNITFSKDSETFENENYTAIYKVKDDVLYLFLIAKTNNNLTGDNTIMTIEYNSNTNYRKASFSLDTTFDNIVMRYNGENTEIEDVKYHYSLR